LALILLKIPSIKKILNVFILLLFVGLILARDVIDISVNSYVFVALAVIFFAINDADKTVAAMAFLIPSYNGIQYVIIYLIGIAILILKDATAFQIRPVPILCTMLIILIELFAGFNEEVVLNLTALFRFFGMFIFSFLLFPSYSKKLDYALVLKAFLWGTLFMVVNILWQYIIVYGVSAFITLGIRVGDVTTHFYLTRGFRVSNDQNLLGIISATAISSALILNYRKSGSGLYLLFIPAFLIFGFLTQSRTFLLTIAVMFTYYMFASLFKGKEKNVNRTVLIFIIVVTLLVVTYYIIQSYFPQYVENLTSRLEAEDITGGRSRIFQFYNEFMLNNPGYIPFGTGMLSYRQVSGYGSIHNGFQEVFVSWGVIGCLLVTLMMISLYKSSSMAKKFEPIRLLPIIMYIIPIQTIQWFNSGGMVLLNIIWISSVNYLSSYPRIDNELIIDQTVVD